MDDQQQEPVRLDHREWQRDGKHLLTLWHRPGWRNNAWLVEHFHAYNGGGGFGFNPSFNDEAEAHAYYARKVDEEEAKHAEWLAEQDKEKPASL